MLGLVSIIVLFVQSRMAERPGPLRTRHRCRSPPHEGMRRGSPTQRQGRNHLPQLPPYRRGGRHPPRLAQDRLPLGQGRQATVPEDPRRPPPLPRSRDPRPGHRTSQRSDRLSGPGGSSRTERRSNMVGALLLGFVCGVIARALMPGDVFRGMSGPASWAVSLGLGLAGALVGYVIFTLGLGIGDTDIFDWGGLLSALIGALIVLALAGYFLRRRQPRPTASPRPPEEDGPRPVS